jgi:hypothetical protein
MSEYHRVKALVDRAYPGAGLLDELHAAITRYLVMPSPEATDAVALWIVASHAQPAWEHATRLGILGPEKRCGKSRLLDVVEKTCHRPLITLNATTSAIYRSINAAEPPTLLFDEVDAIFGGGKRAEDNEDLRALLNAGHGRGRPVLRCVGPTQEVKAFPSFAMAALAGIGTLPDTIADRAVVITMRRRKPGEAVQKFRERRDGAPLNDLRTRLHEWARANLDQLAEAEPAMPVEDRAADTWESLIAIADLAGGAWPDRARRAAQTLVAKASQADAEGSLSTRLLADIRASITGLTGEFIATETLLQRLYAIDDAPWRDFELTPRKLADRLKKYEIKPGRDSTGSTRGYQLADFTDTFERYLPDIRQNPSTRQNPTSAADASPSSDASTRQSQPTEPGPAPTRQNPSTRQNATSGADASPPSDASNRQTPPTRQALTSASDGLTAPDTPPPESARTCPTCSWPIGSLGCTHHDAA